MKNAIKILVILLIILLVAAGIAWYMLQHGGQQQGSSTDITAARQTLSDIKANSTLKFSVAVTRTFDWYVDSGAENPTRLQLPGVAMVAKNATADQASKIDAWLRAQGFSGDAENSSFGDTSVSEGYVKGSVAVIVETPVSSSGTTQQVTELAVYAGILPAAATPSSPSN